MNPRIDGDGKSTPRQITGRSPKPSQPPPIIPLWAWIAAVVLLLAALFTAWQSQRFGGEFADLQQRITQELQRGHSLESEQERYQKR